VLATVAVPVVIYGLMPLLHRVRIALLTQRAPVRPKKRASDMNATPRRTRMKAITQDRYGSADVLRHRDIDEPTPGDHEVLVRVQATGIARGVLHVMTGEPYLMRLMGCGLLKPKNPVLSRKTRRRADVVGIFPDRPSSCGSSARALKVVGSASSF
jgi:hypothetical protein